MLKSLTIKISYHKLILLDLIEDLGFEGHIIHEQFKKDCTNHQVLNQIFGMLLMQFFKQKIFHHPR